MKKISTNIRYGQQPRRQDQSPGVVELHGGQSHRRAKSSKYWNWKISPGIKKLGNGVEFKFTSVSFWFFRTWQFAFWVTLLDSDLSLALTVGFATCARWEQGLKSRNVWECIDNFFRPDLRVVRCGVARRTNALGAEESAPTTAAFSACRTKGLGDDFFCPLVIRTLSEFLKVSPKKEVVPFLAPIQQARQNHLQPHPNSFYITQRILSLPIATMYQKIISRQVNLLKAGLKSTQASARRGPRESWIIWYNARSSLHLSPKNLRISKWS